MGDMDLLREGGMGSSKFSELVSLNCLSFCEFAIHKRRVGHKIPHIVVILFKLQVNCRSSFRWFIGFQQQLTSLLSHFYCSKSVVNSQSQHSSLVKAMRSTVIEVSSHT